MVNPIYGEMRDLSKELFGEFAQGKIEYVAMVPGNGPPDSPGPSVPVYYEINATARPVRTKYVNGSTILSTDRQLSMPDDTRFVPDTSGFIRVDNVQYKIVQCDPLPAAGEPVTWRIFFRK